MRDPDLRVDEAGEVYLLEINPNCGCSIEGSFTGRRLTSSRRMRQGHRGLPLHLLGVRDAPRDQGA